ncbi:hypothetical protein D3C81_2288570 [compost metagenome]
MAVSRAVVVAFRAPVVGQLDLGLGRIATFEAQEGQRVLVLGVLRSTQQLHAQYVSIKINSALKVANAQHRV